MSAILKALKKLEDQTTDGFAAARSGAQMPQERLPGHAVRKTSWHRPGFWAVVMASLGFLAAGGVWIHKTLPVNSPFQDSESKSEEGFRSAAQPIRTPHQGVPKPKDVPVKPAPPQSGANVPKHAKPPIQNVSPASPFPDSKPQVKPKLNAPPAVQTSQDTPVVHDDPPPPPSMPHRSADNSVPKSAAPPLLKDSSLRIQAIAWAEDPLRRIVVIDGNILHEGETVNDCFIQNIHPDAIEIRRGGKLWTIEFRIN